MGKEVKRAPNSGMVERDDKGRPISDVDWFWEKSCDYESLLSEAMGLIGMFEEGKPVGKWRIKAIRDHIRETEERWTFEEGTAI